MADEPDLRPDEGADRDWVAYLQGVLRTLGFDPGDSEGDYGAGTEQAVRSFQESNSCTVDGWVGRQTWEKIQGLLGGGDQSDADETAGESGPANVPDELVAMGLPASTEQFTPEQHAAVFVGNDLGDEEESGSPEGVELLAINEGDDEGGSWA